jgi:hypothetical protein
VCAAALERRSAHVRQEQSGRSSRALMARWRNVAGALTSAFLAGMWELEELVARGEQRIGCMRRQEPRMVPTAIPEALRAALQRYE